MQIDKIEGNRLRKPNAVCVRCLSILLHGRDVHAGRKIEGQGPKIRKQICPIDGFPLGDIKERKAGPTTETELQ